LRCRARGRGALSEWLAAVSTPMLSTTNRSPRIGAPGAKAAGATANDDLPVSAFIWGGALAPGFRLPDLALPKGWSNPR